MFGTTTSCFLTASSSGREAAGAVSIVAGVGMRDSTVSFLGSMINGPPDFVPNEVSGSRSAYVASWRQSVT